MRFGNPEYFLLLFLIPLLIGFFIWAYQQKKNALRRFASMNLIKKLTPNNGLGRQIVKWTLFCFFFMFLVFSLVRPQFGVKMEMVERKGIDIVVALDISKSMLAQDITPNRLERAKHEVSKLIDMLKGDRIGIVVFAGESHVQCPLTLDYGTAKMFLNAVDVGWVGIEGTSISDAIKKATDAFQSKVKKHKVMLVISDGEEHDGKAVEAAKEAAKEGIIIHTIGVGSENGVPIPISSGNGNVVYKKDKSGNLVMTRLNPVTLEKVALESNGKYFHAESNLDLSRILGEIARMEKKDLGSGKLVTYEERFQIFLFIALILLFVEFFIPQRMKLKKEWKGRFE